MKSIQVEQAVFSSSNRGSMKGYQLVARSPGIDRDTGNELSRWAPTRMMHDDPARWTLNAFPISGERFAVTRTVIGGPEYSGRGASQVVTLILVLDADQFSRYSHDPILVARTAIAVGALKLPIDPYQEKLDVVTLPNEPLLSSPNPAHLRAEDQTLANMLDEVNQLLVDSRRVALVGASDPLVAVGTLLAQMGSAERSQLSLTTGLAPAISRPFQLHFLESADAPMRHTLSTQSISIVEAP